MVDYSKSLSGNSVPPRQAERFFESLLTRSRDISSTRAGLEEEILQLSRQIDMLLSCETKKQGKTSGEVTVVIMAKTATTIELRLTYRMSLSMLNYTEFYPLTAQPLASCPKRDVVCCVRATRHHGSRHSRVIGIPALSCPDHAKYRRRLDKRRAHTQHRSHGPIQPGYPRPQSYEDPTPNAILQRLLRSHAGATTASRIRECQCQQPGSQEKWTSASAIQCFRCPCRRWLIWRHDPASGPRAATATATACA